MTATQEEILNLRALNLTPKQIARKLGIKVSEVNGIIQNQAQQTKLDRLSKGELDPVYQCLASENLIQLLPDIPSENNIKKGVKNDDDIARGLGLVVISRVARYNQITVCSYLLDIWCLGVKDTIPPRTIDKIKFQEFAEALFDPFPGEPHLVSLGVAQGMIFSACEYAENLGFQAHKDFEKSRSHIGEWDRKIRIECGRDGKPCYVDGPHDDPIKIMRTLRENKGEGNFDFMVGGSSY
ncbi:MAG: helix-turn-helix transcriptional regulator [Cyanobacteria bacterium J06629_18]